MAASLHKTPARDERVTYCRNGAAMRSRNIGDVVLAGRPAIPLAGTALPHAEQIRPDGRCAHLDPESGRRPTVRTRAAGDEQLAASEPAGGRTPR